MGDASARPPVPHRSTPVTTLTVDYYITGYNNAQHTDLSARLTLVVGTSLEATAFDYRVEEHHIADAVSGDDAHSGHGRLSGHDVRQGALQVEGYHGHFRHVQGEVEFRPPDGSPCGTRRRAPRRHPPRLYGAPRQTVGLVS